jgi:hypothetical protein
MKQPYWVFAIDVLAALFLLGLLLLMPRIARRGLLFGVYVGETAGVGDEARRIGRRYTVDVLLAAGLSIAAGAASLGFVHRAVALAGVPLLLVVLGQVAYFRRPLRWMSRRAASPTCPGSRSPPASPADSPS